MRKLKFSANFRTVLILLFILCAVEGVALTHRLRSLAAVPAINCTSAPAAPASLNTNGATAYASGSYGSGSYGIVSGAPNQLSSSSAKLYWSASTPAAGCVIQGYHVYRDNQLLTTTSATTYLDASLLPGKSYIYTVSAFDENAHESAKTSYSVITPGSQASVRGDANRDGRVNGIDLSILLSHDGQNYPTADFNSDGIVGAADLAIMLSAWTW